MKLSIAGIFYMSLLGSAGVVIFGAIYGYSTAAFWAKLNPDEHLAPTVIKEILGIFDYLIFALTVLYGFAVGYLISIGARVGKVRNQRVVLIFGYIFGVIAVYSCWVSWMYTNLHFMDFQASSFLNAIELISDRKVFGALAWYWNIPIYLQSAVWVIEAVVIIECCASGSTKLVSAPFFERCNQCTNGKDIIPPLKPKRNPRELKNQKAKHWLINALIVIIVSGTIITISTIYFNGKLKADADRNKEFTLSLPDMDAKTYDKLQRLWKKLIKWEKKALNIQKQAKDKLFNAKSEQEISNAVISARSRKYNTVDDMVTLQRTVKSLQTYIGDDIAHDIIDFTQRRFVTLSILGNDEIREKLPAVKIFLHDQEKQIEERRNQLRKDLESILVKD